MTATLTALILALAAPQDRARGEIESKLSNLRITLDFQDAPLDAVIDYCREISGINVFVDAKVREMELSISIKVKDIALKSVLGLMLSPHGVGTMYRDGVLMVMTQEDIQDRSVKLELYDCRDILYPIKDFPGVDIDLNTDNVGVTTQLLGGDEGDDVFPIEELVRSHTGGTTWDDNPKASVVLQNGILIVKNSADVHTQILRLLNMLRRHK